MLSFIKICSFVVEDEICMKESHRISLPVCATVCTYVYIAKMLIETSIKYNFILKFYKRQIKPRYAFNAN